MKSIGKNYLKEVLKSDKPLVKERLAALLPAPEGIETEPPITSLIGVALHSRESTIGAIILLYRSPEPINHSGLRLLSGMANIMGMNIENKALYRQSIQKKSEVDFLFRSIVKFNKTLDLQATLTSVAEKGVEYCGVNSRVYLFSQIKAQVIISSYQRQKDCYVISSSLREKNEFGTLRQIYLELSGIINEKPILIRNIVRCRKIAPEATPWFCEQNIYSLIAVPLKVGPKALGMLLLVRGQEATSFGQHEMQFAEALASAASLTIENARAYSASQEMSDFLEKKISEKTSEILQLQARQRVRVENRKDIIFQVNRHNRFIFANKAMEVLSGLPREILCHKDFSADGVVAAEERNYINSLFRKILAGKLPVVKDAEYRHVNHKGDDHIISLTIFPEFDQHGQVTGVEGVGRDVTEKKRLETELKKAKELALLGEFSSAVAHQMRNPLGNILMGTKRLESALGLDDGSVLAEAADRTGVAEILRNLSQGVYNLNQVVTELLEYTKTLKLRPSSQRMDIIMRETVHTFASLLDQNNIKVHEYFQEPLPAIPVDAVLIGQVIQNVIYNAIQAMPEGGKLALFANLAEQNSNQMFLSIRDSGLGIDPSEINRVFRPFYTTKKLGTGLGLSVAHRIVEAHGGRIQVCRNPCPHTFWNNARITTDSEAKDVCGTTVHIMLPVAVMSDRKI
jgi:PAS domain S-box-containing protein